MKTVEFKFVELPGYGYHSGYVSNVIGDNGNHSGTYVLASEAEAEISALHSEIDDCHKRMWNEQERIKVLEDALRRIEEGCSFPEDEVQKACRDTARKALEVKP